MPPETPSPKRRTGLTVLGAEKHASRTTLELLIAYDNDPHATGVPSRIQTATLVGERD